MNKEIQNYYKSLGIKVVFLPIKKSESLAEKIEALLVLISAKKQHDEEPMPKAIDQVLKKCFDSFYRQLARFWHPDLERDYKQKCLKESIIKKLTLAYKNNDLSELLILEMEWLSKQTAQNAVHRASTELLLMYEYADIMLVYGHGFNVISKTKIKYGLFKARARMNNKPQIRAIQSL